MMQPMPKKGDEIWGNDVVLKDGEYVFVPRKVIFECLDRGLFWYTTVDGGGRRGWYSDSFFWTEKESQQECDLLNREANGEHVRSSLVAHDIQVALEKAKGPVRIF